MLVITAPEDGSAGEATRFEVGGNRRCDVSQTVPVVRGPIVVRTGLGRRGPGQHFGHELFEGVVHELAPIDGTQLQRVFRVLDGTDAEDVLDQIVVRTRGPRLEPGR